MNGAGFIRGRKLKRAGFYRCMKVNLVVHDPWKVFLVHLLLSRYPPQPTLSPSTLDPLVVSDCSLFGVLHLKTRLRQRSHMENRSN